VGEQHNCNSHSPTVTVTAKVDRHLIVHAQVGEADDGAGGKVYINKYEAQIAETEDEAAYQTSMTAPKIPVVINEAKKNMYGSPRGYKVQLNRPMVNLEPAGYERSKALGEWLF
jgi:hypothetical protein